MSQTLTQGPNDPGPNPVSPVRIARTADAYYVSIAPEHLTNDSNYVKQLSVYLDGLLEDETVILSIDPDNVMSAPWCMFMTVMGAIQSAKCKVIVRCDKIDFFGFGYLYLLGDELDFHQTGALFFCPLYSNNKEALGAQERVGLAYLLTIVKKAVDRGILTEDQYALIDSGGYTNISYDTMLQRKRDGLADSVLLRE